jgi:tetratricopeptide (TPR) repeat protein
MPHRPVKSILSMAGAAVWMVSGCAATPPSFTPQISEMIAGEHATRDYAWHHQTGVAHLKAARYGLALFELRTALRENPRSVETLNAIGIAYDHLGRFDQSLHFYERALALDPNAVQTLNNLGRSAARQGDIASAIAWLDRARKLDPGSREVADNLAEARDQSVAAVASFHPLFPARTTPAQPVSKLAGRPMSEPVTAWVERTDRVQQTLVTTAPLQVLQTLASLDLPPELVNVAGVTDHSLTRRPVMTPGRRGDAASHADAPEQFTRIATATPATAAPAPAAPAASPTRFEISNGAGRRGMAARMREHLLNSDAARLTNADHFAHATSAIFYRPGFADSAAAFSQSLPLRVELIEDDRQRSDVRLRLGGDLLDFDLRLLTKT